MPENGHIIDIRPTSGAIRVVRNLRLQNVDGEGVTYLMLGDDKPEIAVALTPDQTEALIAHLNEHMNHLTQIAPGEAHDH